MSARSRHGPGPDRRPDPTLPDTAVDAARGEGEGEVVLVIEDDPAVRRLTLRRLRLLGYETLDAASGPEAILRLEAGAAVALVFSDVVMPGGMSGHDIARWVRAHRPGVGVLLTSGYDAPEHASGADGPEPGVALLGKPYALEELARGVRDALVHAAGPAASAGSGRPG